MIDQRDIEALERFLKGLSSPEEEKYIYALFSKHEGNNEFRQHLSEEFTSYLKNKSENGPDVAYILDRVHHEINKKNSREQQSVIRKIYRWYSVAAAVLIIPLIALSGIWFAKQKLKENYTEAPVVSKLFAPLGARISFTLPDGTACWLNSGSSLEYQLPFCHNRQVAVAGEAWFDVAHDEAHPFVVRVNDAKLEVLGTKFNLNAYPDENQTEVVLEEGKVSFLVPGRSRLIEMKPNERLVCRNGAINIEVTEAEKYSGWKEGKLIFRGDAMEEVARRIERWYNIDVELVDKGLKNHIIYGTFQDDSLEDVFKYLSMTSPIRYRLLERKMLDDGTWQKKKVLLYNK